MPTVTTYSNVFSEVPSEVWSLGAVALEGWVSHRRAEAPFFLGIFLRMLSARSWSRKSTPSAVDVALSAERNGEHGPRRWYNGDQVRFEDGFTLSPEQTALGLSELVATTRWLCP
uniref:Uncharacterized protein n=1 Tax=Arundo donax TaxID=35708 RepID=A0A0A9E2G8_ARUDO